MCDCFGGQPVNFENLKTPEQQNMMAVLASIIGSGLGKGTTPYYGQLTAPMTQPQLAASKAMMQIGGYPSYVPKGPKKWRRCN